MRRGKRRGEVSCYCFCRNCGSVFVSSRRHARWCTPACRQAGLRFAAREKQTKEFCQKVKGRNV